MAGEVLGHEVLIDAPLRVLRVGNASDRDDLRGGHAVARGGLRSQRADLRLQDLATQRGASRCDVCGLVGRQQLFVDEQLQDFFESQGGARIDALHTRRVGT